VKIRVNPWLIFLLCDCTVSNPRTPRTPRNPRRFYSPQPSCQLFSASPLRRYNPFP